MITDLRIQNVALIDEARANFASGLNVLTGETGAGKSIIVDSISFLLGGRPVRDFIRSGADFAHVEGIIEFEGDFITEELAHLGIDADENQIMLARTMQATTGKSTCRINGRSVSVGVLRDVASLFVDLHGQHEHQSLLDNDKQIKLLDGFCGENLTEMKKSLDILLKQYREANRDLKKLAGVGNQRQEQIALWSDQLEEINEAAIKPDEEDALKSKRTRLMLTESLHTNAASATKLLIESETDEQSALGSVSKAVINLAEIAKIDTKKTLLYERLVEVHAGLEDIARDLSKYLEDLDADPIGLAQIEERLDVIYRIKKKFGPTLANVLKKQKDLETNLNHLEESETRIKELQIIRRDVSKDITALCDAMHRLRSTAATEIAMNISGVLKDLGMGKAEFSIEIVRKKSFGSDGNDTVEFMISPNPGEPVKPLRRIASGGEMSRVMLAIKTVMADADSVSTVIFDEVDTGVSGRTAQQVAEKLMNISRKRQILCITHLPQIAAMADTHFLIEKSSEEVSGRTITKVDAMEETGIINELARLIGGAKITKATLAAAKEMKVQANGLKS